MGLLSDELIANLRAIDNANERARTIIEWGLEGHPDPRLEELEGTAASGQFEYSRRLAAGRRAPPRKLSEYRQLQRFERIYGKCPPRRSPPVEDVPLVRAPPRRRRRVKPIQIRTDIDKDNWVVVGIHDHLARVAAQESPSRRSRKARGHKGKSPEAPAQGPSSAMTAAEATRVYEAISFAMWRYQRVMNVHLIVRWNGLGIDGAQVPKKLSAFLNQASKWATERGDRRRGRPLEEMRAGTDLLWVYVNENSAKYGPHTHILLSLSEELIIPFRQWAWRCLGRLGAWGEAQKGAVHLRRSYSKPVDKVVHDQWRWFRYLIKQLGRDEIVGTHPDGTKEFARTVFSPFPQRKAPAVVSGKLVGTCEKLGQKARRDGQFLSAIAGGYWNDVYDGEEMRLDQEFAEDLRSDIVKWSKEDGHTPSYLL